MCRAALWGGRLTGHVFDGGLACHCTRGLLAPLEISRPCRLFPAPSPSRAAGQAPASEGTGAATSASSAQLLQAFCGVEPGSLPAPGSRAGFMGPLQRINTTRTSYGYCKWVKLLSLCQAFLRG